MIVDRCYPNPCKHEAPCAQTGSQFFCNCNVTGYGGSVCHMSEHFTSCSEYGLFHSMANEKKFNITIDLDGSGVLEPINVECDFNNPVEIITRVYHANLGYVRVDGYDAPGSYRRKINYLGNSRASLSELTRRSVRCEQAIAYRCRNARLLKLPTTGGGSYVNRAYGWWVGRKNQPRFYWGGGVPDIQRCACGVIQDCEQDSPTCNCDYVEALQDVTRVQMVDSGNLNFKDDLPVTEVFFGDTGTLNDDKWSEHSVDVLKCYGDLQFDNTVTFRRSDASIELNPIYAENEFDMSFIFKTTIRDAVIIQNTGKDSGHFFEVRIRGGTSIRFAYNVGNGMQLLEMLAPGWLNNNEWHVVRLERNRKESRLIVDQNKPVVLIEPQDRSFQQFAFDQKLFVGTSEAYTDGYLGCISNLIINGVIQDLKGAIQDKRFAYGTSPGCVGKCEPNPCLNLGECYEFYSHYNCECGLTSWRGFICGRHCGASFNLQESPMMIIDLSKMDKLGTLEEYIEVGFKTKTKSGLLMQVYGEGDENYITLKINSNGGISIEFDVGFKRFEITTQGLPDLTNNQHHVVRAWRTEMGRTWNIKVDDYDTIVKSFTEHIRTENADTRLDKPRVMYLSRNITMDPGEGFDGCMYQAQWNNIFPFRLAFQNPPDPAVNMTGGIREDQCGYVEILPKPEPLEIRPTPELPNYIDFQREEDQSLMYRRVIAGVVVGLVMLIILIFLIFFCRHFTIERGNYETREAKGTSRLLAADDAIRYGRSGQPEVQENEYWI
ncbi:hypothetical protein Ciccas_012230 [Cichlidogyrus casuarinus]|uniref:Neurexin-4 n=1 Tax=Cichlidogyrus casuarinus TaxID=1844966 RepID=A0ABD2PNZ2_9PLAT